MAKSRDQLKILLLQIREDPETAAEEFREFCEFSRVTPSQMDVLNTYESPSFEPEVITGYDALFVGGSSDASVLDTQKYPFVVDCFRLLRRCYEQDIPVLASCFGFQIAVMEMGGQVILDKANMEMGTYPICLTDAAKDDPLLYDLPERFWAVSGHKERASTLPDKTTLLGYTERCPNHIIRFDKKPFYAFQFHPELSSGLFRERITRYQDRYFTDKKDFEKMLENAIYPSDIANSILDKFIDRVVLS